MSLSVCPLRLLYYPPYPGLALRNGLYPCIQYMAACALEELIEKAPLHLRPLNEEIRVVEGLVAVFPDILAGAGQDLGSALLEYFYRLFRGQSHLRGRDEVPSQKHHGF